MWTYIFLVSQVLVLTQQSSPVQESLDEVATLTHHATNCLTCLRGDEHACPEYNRLLDGYLCQQAQHQSYPQPFQYPQHPTPQARSPPIQMTPFASGNTAQGSPTASYNANPPLGSYGFSSNVGAPGSSYYGADSNLVNSPLGSYGLSTGGRNPAPSLSIGLGSTGGQSLPGQETLSRKRNLVLDPSGELTESLTTWGQNLPVGTSSVTQQRRKKGKQSAQPSQKDLSRKQSELKLPIVLTNTADSNVLPVPLHELITMENNGKKVYRRCCVCYNNIKEETDRDTAQNTATNTCAYCPFCEGQPKLCVKCFNKTHNRTEEIESLVVAGGVMATGSKMTKAQYTRYNKERPAVTPGKPLDQHKLTHKLDYKGEVACVPCRLCYFRKQLMATGDPDKNKNRYKNNLSSSFYCPDCTGQPTLCPACFKEIHNTNNINNQH